MNTKNETCFCQSCGMPLTEEIDSHSVAELNLLGTNADHPMKKVFIEEVNALAIPGLHIDNLYVLQGSFINQPYNINGNEVKLLDDNATYWGNQVIAPSPKGEGKGRGCYGIACCEKYILVSEYGKDGTNPELVILKRR